MCSPVSCFFHDHVLVKEPGTSIVTPWPQDSPCYCVGGQQSVSFWIPLDPAGRETTLECVAGSHLWGVNHKPKRFDGTDLYEGDTAVEMPDIEARRADYRLLGWAMEPGDAVGVLPPGVTARDVYRGVTPFVILQLIGMGLVILIPAMATWLRSILF